MRILIINLTRLGDIIQSLGLIRGLKRMYPGAEIDYLAMSSFSKILDNISELNQVITLDDHILIDQIQEDFWSGMIEITQKIEVLNQRNYDMIINPVISMQSAYLTYMIKAKKKKGMTFTADQEQSIQSEWSAFLLANQHNLGDHAFNLVDIFAGVGDIQVIPEDYTLDCSKEAKQKINQLWMELGLKGKKVIGFHIGASQSNKAWDIKQFKELIINLVKSNQYEILLFGGYKELEVKGYFHDIENANFHNLIGSFNLDELIGAISKVDLFVTNDTGPMHIAATTKRAIINVSLGPVSMWETGPYNQESYVIQADIECHPCNFEYVCPHWDCHKYISPEEVFSLITSYFGRDLKNYVYNKQVLVWKTVRDPFNMHHWVPIRKRKIRQKELIFELKRAIWAMTLLKGLQPETDWMEKYYQFIKKNYETELYDHQLLINSLEELISLSTDINEKLFTLSKLDPTNKKNLDKIKKLWSDVRAKKEDLFSKAKENSVIYDWFWNVTFRESQIEGDSLSELAKQSSSMYYNLSMQLLALKRGLKEFK